MDLQLQLSLKTVALTLLLVAAICIMILPVPSWVLDIGVAASFALAILMLIITLFIEKPLDFSAFPTILLGALVLRLSLNIASTKLIIGDGHTGTDAAGNVIEGFAMFIMSGNLAIGLVVFCVLLIVNFVVISKGATRMAEVGARFALDAMPGKQLAIDSDIASGAISHDEGKNRRSVEQAETTFFGSLDGTSKFVKGDAVAGLIITLLNLIVGLAIGVFANGMPISYAFSTYSILTVGDGLVSQIPAVLISLAAAILLARGGTTGTTSEAVGSQLSRHPIALLLVGGLLALLGLFPGLPLLPFLGLATIAIIVAGAKIYFPQEVTELIADDSSASDEINPAETTANILEIEEIQIIFSNTLIAMVLDPKSGLESRINNIRKHIAATFGVLIPEIHLTDSASVPDLEYQINILDTEVGRFRVNPDAKLVINPTDDIKALDGPEISEPVYGAPAKWLDAKDAELATLSGQTVIDPSEVIATHLLNLLIAHLSNILTYSALQERIDQMSNNSGDPVRSQLNKNFLQALIPEKVSMELLHAVLKELLNEKISIRNIRLIIESIAEAKQVSQTFDHIYAHVRLRLARTILKSSQDSNRKVNALQISELWNSIFAKHLSGTSDTGYVGLPPQLISDLTDHLKAKIGASREDYGTVIISCADRYRKFIRDVVSAARLDVPVLSYSEVASADAVNVVGLVSPD